MKHLLLIFLAVISFVIYNGCDSATDSKSTSTTPPVLVSPYDNDSNVARLTTFQWTGTADVIWVDVNASFSTPLTYAVSGTSYTLTSPLNANSYYYWKAGRTIGTTIYWSDSYFYFRTGPN